MGDFKIAVSMCSERSSVAISAESFISKDFFPEEGKRHAEWLAPSIRGLVNDNGLDMANLKAVLVDRGPGQFTSIRTGAVTACMLSMATGCDIFSTSSFELLAMKASSEGFDVESENFLVILSPGSKRSFAAIMEKGSEAMAFSCFSDEIVAELKKAQTGRVERIICEETLRDQSGALRGFCETNFFAYPRAAEMLRFHCIDPMRRFWIKQNSKNLKPYYLQMPQTGKRI